MRATFARVLSTASLPQPRRTVRRHALAARRVSAAAMVLPDTADVGAFVESLNTQYDQARARGGPKVGNTLSLTPRWWVLRCTKRLKTTSGPPR